MKKVIIILSCILCVLVVVTVAVIAFSKQEDSPPVTQADDVPEEVQDVELNQTLEEASDSVNKVIDTDKSIITYDGSVYEDDSVPEAVYSEILISTAEEDRNCIFTLIRKWLDSFGGKDSDVILVSSNLDQGYSEIILTVQCNEHIAEVHCTSDAVSHKTIGYLKDTTDKE